MITLIICLKTITVEKIGGDKKYPNILVANKYGIDNIDQENARRMQ